MGAKKPERPFATLDDLKALYPTLEDSERERAQSLLSLVSSAVAALCDWSDKDPAVLKLVTCQATIRVLQAGEETPIGVTSQSWMAYPLYGLYVICKPYGGHLLHCF